jgi:site-specific DNA-methyltransferase (cytosine-N4-specific)
MKDVRFSWRPYARLPYETDLALRETEALLGRVTRIDDTEVVIPPTAPADIEQARRRLTYFDAVAVDGAARRTTQSSLEHSAELKPKRRQPTRYSTHGLHEYRGKFNPQIARALLNIMGVSRGRRVLDPFCGSGTTLVEAAHLGVDATGTDLNPLAVAIAAGKLRLLRARTTTVERTWAPLRNHLSSRVQHMSFERAWSARDLDRAMRRAPDHIAHFEYARSWFPDSVVAQIALVLEAIQEHGGALQSVYRLFLSDLLRDASHQEPADLRIRRRKDPLDNFPLIPRFILGADRKLERAARARSVIGRVSGEQRVQQLDSRRLDNSLGRFDAVLTSPPYATALPYFDTQRLSLCVLGLASPSDLGASEADLVGSREFKADRAFWLQGVGERLDQSLLPPDTLKLLAEMVSALSETDGFRRQQTPALLLRYFSDMQAVMERVRRICRPRAPFALVVGRNRTTLGGHEFLVDTPAHLSAIAEGLGWHSTEVIELNTYQRYDLHHGNAIRQEALVMLEA